MYRSALVVPCYNEPPETLARLVATVPRDVLVALVVNCRPGASRQAQATNKRLLGADLGANVVALDYSSDPRRQLDFADGGGAGTARMLGARFALAEDCASRWVHFTDADTELPANYFASADDAWREDSALYMRAFDMVCEPGMSEHERWAVAFWNLATLTALVGRTRALCPWPCNFSTIGVERSLLRRGGYPSYAVGEDFMVVHHYGKLGRIHRVAGDPVRVSGRVGSRGPAGCGDHIADYARKHAAGVPAECYSPAVYAHLRAFYEAVRLAALRPDASEREIIADVCAEPGILGTTLDATIVKDIVLSTLGDLRCARWANRCTGEVDFAMADGVLHSLGACFPFVPLAESVRRFGWAGDGFPSFPASIDASLRAARECESRECFRDYGAYERGDA